MTQKQLQLMKLIDNYVQTTGEAPTYSEMKRAIGVTSNQTVSDHLDALERSGLIKRLEGQKRGIIVTGQGKKLLVETGITMSPLPSLDALYSPAVGSTSSLPVVNNGSGQPKVTLTTPNYGGINYVPYNRDYQSSGNRLSG